MIRFSPQGVQESIYDLPLQESVALSRRFIAISPDGDVYFLRSRKSGVDVIGVGSRNVRPTAVIDNPTLPRLADYETRIAGKGPLAQIQAGLHITGALVLPFGIAMADLGHTPVFAIIGSLIVLAALTLFAFVVFRTEAAA